MIPFILAAVGGYLVAEGTKDKQIFANGGMTPELQKRLDEMESSRMNIRLKIATIIGVDNALKYLNIDYVVSPFRLIEAAVLKGFITIDEINQDVWESALQEAKDIDERYRDSGEGIGSSDMNAFVSNMLNDAGIKIVVVNNRYQREDKMCWGGNLENGGKIESIAEEIQIIDGDVWDKLKIKSGTQLKEDKAKKEYYKLLEKNGVDDKIKSLTSEQRKEVHDLLEDENYHSLNTYLATKGYYGKSMKESYDKY
jgi:hypothetical protein